MIIIFLYKKKNRMSRKWSNIKFLYESKKDGKTPSVGKRDW